jgi:single-strand DNA-binding protein
MEDKEGQDRYTTEIRGDRMQMLGGRQGMSDAPPRESAGAGSAGGGNRPARRSRPAATSMISRTTFRSSLQAG